MKRIDLHIGNMLFGDNQNKYAEFKGKYIVCGFTLSISPESNWKFLSINNLVYSGDTHKLNISSTPFSSSDMLENTCILNDVTLNKIYTYFDNKFINYYFHNGRLYIYILFSIDNNGNVANLEFLNNGLTIKAELSDNAESISILDISYQGIPTKQGCPIVVNQINNITSAVI